MPSSGFSKYNAFLLSALMTKTICACASCWGPSSLSVGESQHGQEAPVCVEFHIESVMGNLARGSALPQRTYNTVSRGSGERNQTQQQWKHTATKKEDKNGGDLSQRVITEAAFFRPRSSLLNLNFRDQYIRFARTWQENNEGKNLTSQVFYG